MNPLPISEDLTPTPRTAPWVGICRNLEPREKQNLAQDVQNNPMKASKYTFPLTLDVSPAAITIASAEFHFLLTAGAAFKKVDARKTTMADPGSLSL
jgi:hypothetical protein